MDPQARSHMSRFNAVAATMVEEFNKPYGHVYSDDASDCFFTGLAVVDAVRGTELRKTYKGRYKTLLAAQRALKKEGHDSLVSFFAGHLEQIAPLQAYIGDLAVVSLPVEGKDRMAEHVGIHTGKSICVKTEAGKVEFAPDQAIAAFRV